MKHKLFLFTLFLGISVGASAEPLGFDEALHRILERSTDIQIQMANVEAADSGVTGKKAAFLPNLSASGQRGNGTTNGTYSLPSQSMSASSTLNLFRWGSDLNQLEGAREDLLKSKDSLENIKLSTEELGVGALANEIQGRMQVEVLQKDLTAYENYFNIAKLRFQRGLLAKEEVDKVNVDLSNVKARLRDAESQSSLNRSNLARLIGLSVDIKNGETFDCSSKS
jgi:outer membrane protein